MHVLVLPYAYPIGPGPQVGSFLSAQVKGLAGQGIRVGVAYAQIWSPRSLNFERVRAVQRRPQIQEGEAGPMTTLSSFGPPGRRLRRRAEVGGFLRCARAYMQAFGRPDLIHAHGLWSAGTAACIVARELGIPWVLTEHSSRFVQPDRLAPKRRDELGATLEHADCVLAVSDYLAQGMREQGILVPSRRCQVLPNCVDTAFFRPPPRSRSDRPAQILAVGFLKPIKRFDWVIRAFAQAKPHLGPTTLVIAGQGPRLKALRGLAHRLGLGDQVNFTGHLSPAQLREQMWQSQFLVSASERETHGVAIVEALATGLRVVATRCGGPEETIKPGDGLLVPKADLQALADAMIQMKVRQSEQHERDIRERCMARFAPGVIATQLVEIYGECLGDDARRAYHL